MTVPKEAPDRTVASAERTLAILDAFLGQDRLLTLTELSSSAGLFPSVVSRYLISLERRRYISRSPDGRYRPGPRLLELGKRYEASFDILDFIQPALARLVAASGETATFFVRDGDSRVCLARREPAHTLKVSVLPGTVRPLDDSSVAQVLQSDPTRLRGPALRRSRGVADPHTASIAAPVIGAGGALVGALAISGPIMRFNENDPNLVAILEQEAEALSKELSSH